MQVAQNLLTPVVECLLTPVGWSGALRSSLQLGVQAAQSAAPEWESQELALSPCSLDWGASSLLINLVAKSPIYEQTLRALEPQTVNVSGAEALRAQADP